MQYTLATLALALSASAARIPRTTCTFGLTATGGQSGQIGQLDDGQNRIGGKLPKGTYSINNGEIVDSRGRGCILTGPTTQFQCDQGAKPTGGFSIGQNGELSFEGSHRFYACPASDEEWNLYTTPVEGQDKCVKISLVADGCFDQATTSKAPQPPPTEKPSPPPQTEKPPPATTIEKTQTVEKTKSSEPTTIHKTDTVEHVSTIKVTQPADVKTETITQTQSPKVITSTIVKESTVERTQTIKVTQPAEVKTVVETQKITVTQDKECPAPTAPPAETHKPEQPAPTKPAEPTKVPVETHAPEPSKEPEQPPKDNNNEHACPTNLDGEYQYPHLIVPVNKDEPHKAYGTQYNGKITSSISTIFNFDIPHDYKGQCSLVFLFPEQKDLETSSFTFKGDGDVSFSKLKTLTTQETSYETVGEVEKDFGVQHLTPGSKAVVATFACPAGQRISFKASAVGNTDFEYFQDYNPSPIGAYVTTC